MKKQVLGLLICSLIVVACESGSDGNSSRASSPFEGVWFGEEIAEFQAGSLNLCDEIEDGEFQIDAYSIDKNGAVRDFDVQDRVAVANIPVMWKVKNNGDTYDNLFLNPSTDCENCEGLQGLKMEKLNEYTLVSKWAIKQPEDGTIVNSEVKYLKLDTTQVQDVRNTLNSCTEE